MIQPSSRRSAEPSEAVLNDSRYKRITTAMKKHRRKPDALIEILHVVEDTFGYVPLDAMRYISHEMKVTPSKIYGVVTFYHFFSLKPKGEHNCVVCTGTACHVKGATGILRAIEKEFGLEPGQTSADGALGFQTARCLGCCGLAPAAVLDNQVLAKIQPDEIIARIQSLLHHATT